MQLSHITARLGGTNLLRTGWSRREEGRASPLSFSTASQSFCHILDTEPLTHGPLEEGRDNAYTEVLLDNILSVFKHCKEILNAQALNNLPVKPNCRKCRFPCHDLADDSPMEPDGNIGCSHSVE